MSLDKQTLLVLGASRYQLPTIEYAKSIGLRVVVTDNVPDNPGHKIADKSYIVDTTDKAAVLEIAQLEKVNGAIAPCTDVAVATAACVNEQLGIHSVSFSSTEVLTSKFQFRDFQQDNNLPHPEFHLVNDVNIVASKLDFSQPWIIKPDRSSGSKGIYIIDSVTQLHDRYQDSKSYSLNGVVSIEKCIHGHHGTAEGVVKDGFITDIFCLDRQTAKPPYVCTTGHLTPSKLTAQIQKKIRSSIEQLWLSLDIDNTVFDVDFIWDGEQVYILEASPRLGGNSITQLVSLAYGVNFLDLAICSVLGVQSSQNFRAQHEEVPTAVVLIGVEVAGSLDINFELVAKLSEHDWVDSIDLHAAAGDQVEAFINGRHCLATLFINAGSYDQLTSRVAYIRDAAILKSV